MPREKRPDVVLMIPPGFSGLHRVIKESLKLHKLTHYKEIEPKAGCRRFLLTDGE